MPTPKYGLGPHHGLHLSSFSRATHRVVELRRSHDALSTVVVSRRGSIGPTTRHRVVAPRRSPRRCRLRCRCAGAALAGVTLLAGLAGAIALEPPPPPRHRLLVGALRYSLPHRRSSSSPTSVPPPRSLRVAHEPPSSLESSSSSRNTACAALGRCRRASPPSLLLLLPGGFSPTPPRKAILVQRHTPAGLSQRVGLLRDELGSSDFILFYFIFLKA
ncbi:hypothetical protein Scep_016625 [Stephania cephalantha]|uniref:Uncharacterized protein n=1 Tax=Stephania cephalantha TaxID=152367 RepID=A0AAP0IPX5_9MAGN